jgi:hypothetical protein
MNWKLIPSYVGILRQLLRNSSSKDGTEVIHPLMFSELFVAGRMKAKPWD